MCWELLLSSQNKEISGSSGILQYDKLSDIFNEKIIVHLSNDRGLGVAHSIICPFFNMWLAISGNGVMKDGAADKRLIEHWTFFN